MRQNALFILFAFVGKMQFINALTHGVLYVLVIIQMVIAGGGNNCSQEILKSNLSCPSSEKWQSLIPPYVFVTKKYKGLLFFDRHFILVFQNKLIFAVVILEYILPLYYDAG